MARCQATTRSGRQCLKRARPEYNGLCTIHYRMQSSPRPRVREQNPSAHSNNHSHVKLWLLEMEARLVRVERQLRHGRIGPLELDLGRCDAMLSSILELLEAEGGDTGPFYRKLVGFRLRLLDARSKIAMRRNVWWRRLRRAVGAADR